MTQTVPDISPLMPMHQDPLLVIPIPTINTFMLMCWTASQAPVVAIWHQRNPPGPAYKYSMSLGLCTMFPSHCDLFWLCFTHILQDSFTCIGAIIWLPQCKWRIWANRLHDSFETDNMNKKINKTKHKILHISRQIRYNIRPILS